MFWVYHILHFITFNKFGLYLMPAGRIEAPMWTDLNAEATGTLHEKLVSIPSMRNLCQSPLVYSQL